LLFFSELTLCYPKKTLGQTFNYKGVRMSRTNISILFFTILFFSFGARAMEETRKQGIPAPWVGNLPQCHVGNEVEPNLRIQAYVGAAFFSPMAQLIEFLKEATEKKKKRKQMVG